MKKTIISLTILAILSVLVACSKTSSTTGNTRDSASLSTEAELLVGTFKLEDTDLAVTSDQAKQLLPLWQTLQVLSTSNTSATEEVNAVVDQIKGTMTAKQLDKIAAMKLTQKDIMGLMGQGGFADGPSTTTTPMALNGMPFNGNGQGSGGAPSGGGMPSGGAPGGAPGGGFPSGGGGIPGGGDPGVSGGASSTPQAVRPGGAGSQVPAPLINALIELLQKKIK